MSRKIPKPMRWAGPTAALGLLAAALTAPGASAAPVTDQSTPVRMVNCANYVNENVTEAVYDTPEGRDCVRLLAGSVDGVAQRHNLTLPDRLANLPAQLAKLPKPAVISAAKASAGLMSAAGEAERSFTIKHATAPSDPAVRAAEVEAARLVVRTLNKAAAETDAAAAKAPWKLPDRPTEQDAHQAGQVARPAALSHSMRRLTTSATTKRLAPTTVARPQGDINMVSNSILVIGMRDPAWDRVNGSFGATFSTRMNFGSLGSVEGIVGGLSSVDDAYLRFRQVNYYGAYGVSFSMNPNSDELSVTKTFFKQVSKSKYTSVFSGTFGTHGDFRNAAVSVTADYGGDFDNWAVAFDHETGFKQATWTWRRSSLEGSGPYPTRRGWILETQAGVNREGLPLGSVAYATTRRGNYAVGTYLGAQPVRNDQEAFVQVGIFAVWP